jgi:membrane protein implicated in regulation of membrane protease activity
MAGLAGNPYGWIFLAALSLGICLRLVLPRGKTGGSAGMRRIAALPALAGLAIAFLLAACAFAGPKRVLSAEGLSILAAVAVLSALALRFPRAIGLPLITLLALSVLALHVVFSDWASPQKNPERVRDALGISGKEDSGELLYRVRARGQGRSWSIRIDVPRIAPGGGAIDLEGSSNAWSLRIEGVFFHDAWAMVGLGKRFRILRSEGSGSQAFPSSSLSSSVLKALGIRFRLFVLASRDFKDFEYVDVVIREDVLSWSDTPSSRN